MQLYTYGHYPLPVHLFSCCWHAYRFCLPTHTLYHATAPHTLPHTVPHTTPAYLPHGLTPIAVRFAFAACLLWRTYHLHFTALPSTGVLHALHLPVLLHHGGRPFTFIPSRLPYNTVATAYTPYYLPHHTLYLLPFRFWFVACLTCLAYTAGRIRLRLQHGPSLDSLLPLPFTYGCSHHYLHTLYHGLHLYLAFTLFVRYAQFQFYREAWQPCIPYLPMTLYCPLQPQHTGEMKRNNDNEM